MPDFTGFGKMIIFMGLGIMIVGIIISLIGKMPGEGSGFSWLGKLPGDFLIKRDNFTFYFPLTTSIIISIVGSLLLYFFIRR
jgi:hypothetical protein